MDVEVLIRASSAEAADLAFEGLHAFVASTISEPPHVLDVEFRDGALAVSHSGRFVQLTQSGWPRLDDLVFLLVKRERPNCIFIHASAVASQDGCILFVGPSSAGKTTLALGLARCGLRLVSNDVVPIHSMGLEVWTCITGNPLRPYTDKLLAKFAAPAALAPNNVPLGLPVRHIFCMSIAQEGKEIDIGDNVSIWRSAHDTIFGERSRPPCSTRALMKQQGPSNFSRAPSTSSMSGPEACQFLCRHLDAPAMPRSQILTTVAAIVKGAKVFNLVSGELTATMELVRQIYTNEHKLTTS